MKYEKDYAGLSKADEKALEDMKFYLGEEVFNKAIEIFSAKPVLRITVEFNFSMVGVEGFPVDAFIRKYVTLKDKK